MVLVGPRGGIFLKSQMGVYLIDMEYIKDTEKKVSKSNFISHNKDKINLENFLSQMSVIFKLTEVNKYMLCKSPDEYKSPPKPKA